MELIRSNISVYCDYPPHDGKWVTSNTVLNSDGNLEVKIQYEERKVFIISNCCVIQAPMDTVWTRVPQLPFRRSVRETFSLSVKKGETIWFLTSSEEERYQWHSALTSFANRKPPPYGDYDNWTYSPSNDPDPKPLKEFKPRKSLTLQHNSGFYTVQLPTKKSAKQPPEQPSSIYSTYDSKLSSLKPQQRSGSYSIQEPKKHGSGEPIVSQIMPAVVAYDLKPETSGSNDCDCCSEACGGCCSACAVCLQQCCLNCALLL